MERTNHRTADRTSPTMLLVLLVTLLALVAAMLPGTLSPASAQEEGAIGYELRFVPGAGDAASVVEATVSYLATGNPAGGLFADILAYPSEERNEGDGEDPRQVMTSATLSEQGTLELEIPAANLEGVEELEVGLDVFDAPDRVVTRGRYFALFTVGEAATSNTPRLSDVAGSTHADNIFELISIGVTSGFSDGTYRPDAPVQRGQLATFLLRSVGFPQNDLPVDVELTDIDGTTHEQAIRLMATYGVVSGYEDGTYRPEGEVTRAQMATYLARTLSLPEAPASDVSDIEGNVHQDAIDRVIAAGLAGGYDDGTYRPGEPVNRGQMATFLIRARAWLFDNV